MSIVSVLPLFIFIGAHLYTCSQLKICSKLPAETDLFSYILVITSFRLFVQSLIISKSGRYTNEFNQSISSPCNWIYFTLLYILPTLEFFTQAITFSDHIENYKVMIIIHNVLKTVTEMFKEYPIMQIITTLLHLIISIVYIVGFYKQHYQVKTNWFFGQTLLQFLLIATAQVQQTKSAFILTTNLFC